MFRVERALAPSSRSSAIVASTIRSAVSDMTARPSPSRTFAACDRRGCREAGACWLPLEPALLPLSFFAPPLSLVPPADRFSAEAARLEREVEGISVVGLDFHGQTIR